MEAEVVTADITGEWSQGVREVFKLAGDITLRIMGLSLLSNANGLAALVEQAGSGEFVGSSRMTKERVKEVLALFASFQEWQSTNLSTGAPPTIVISRKDLPL